jgi:hypothetical protein
VWVQSIGPILKGQEFQEEKDFLAFEDGTDTLSPNVGKNYHSALRNTPADCRSHQYSGGSLKLGDVFVSRPRKVIGEVEVYVHSFFISSLDASERLTSCPGHSNLGKEPRGPLNMKLGGP